MSSRTQLREQLAAAYQLCAYFQYDELTYTHLSARIPHSDRFLIYPFGYLYEEVTADCLLEVDFDGIVHEGASQDYNPTGYAIHTHIYKAREDVQAIFHLHTPASVAVSTHPQGLLPCSQWALHFYNRIAYHDYNGLIFHKDMTHHPLVNDLGHHPVMLLRHHGLIACGNNIPEAFFYTHHLEQACRTQVLLPEQPLIISSEIAESSSSILLNFEKNLGERDWNALMRLLKRLGNPHLA